MNCLILGGSGFLGSHLCERLFNEGHNVRIFHKGNTLWNNFVNLEDRIEYVVGDFSNPLHVQEALQGMQVVYHLISTTVAKTSNENPSYDISTNLIPTLHLLDLCVKERVKKVIFFSSGGTVYGIPNQVPISEDHPTNPICSYGIHKLAIEKYLHLYYNLYGLDYSVLRISNPYGERQRPTGSQGVVAVFFNKIITQKAIEIWGDGSVVRDYLHVSDVVDAAYKVLVSNCTHKIFNIGSGVGLSLKEILEEMEYVTSNKIDVKYLPSRNFDVPTNVLDITRACTELGWAPKIKFREGLKRTLLYSVEQYKKVLL